MPLLTDWCQGTKLFVAEVKGDLVGGDVLRHTARCLQRNIPDRKNVSHQRPICDVRRKLRQRAVVVEAEGLVFGSGTSCQSPIGSARADQVDHQMPHANPLVRAAAEIERLDRAEDPQAPLAARRQAARRGGPPTPCPGTRSSASSTRVVTSAGRPKTISEQAPGNGPSGPPTAGGRPRARA